MTHEEFKALARAWIIENHRTISAASLHYGGHANLFSRCFSGEREFPADMLEDIDYEITNTKSYDKKNRVKEEAREYWLIPRTTGHGFEVSASNPSDWGSTANISGLDIANAIHVREVL